MNKIYRVVWSKSLNLWIVVSENARGVTKKRNVSLMDCSETVDQESLETFSVLIPKLLTIAVSTIFFSISVAVAAVNTGGGTVSNNGSGNSMAISPTGQQCGNAGQATVNGNSGVAVGCGNNISGTDEAFAQALNNRRGTGSNNYPTGVASITSASTAVGKSNRITGVGGATVVGNANISDGSNFHNVAIGQGNRTGGAGYNTALGIGNDANGGNSNVVIGVDNRARSNTAIAMGRGAWADADFSIAQGATATVVQGATSGIALGNSATTKGARGIAIGSATAVNSQYDAATAPNADGADSIAIGTGAKGTGASSTAVGRQAVASGDSSTAMGELAKADNNGDLALGANAHATGVTRDGSTYSAVAVGRNALAQGEDALAVGNSAKATANYAGAVGNFAEASAQNAMAVGNSAKASGNFSSAFGNFSEASGMQSTANGNRAKATADFSSAYGNIAEASGVQSSAIGNSSKASGTRSSAFGDNTKAVGTGSVATGSNTQAMGESSVAMGDSAQAQGDNDIAIGRNAVTASGNSNNIAVGSEVTTGNMGQNVAMGSDGTNANSRTADGGAVAIGRAQTATGNGAVAIGDPNRANGDGAVAMGRNNTAAGNYDASEAGNGAVAIGNENQAIGQGSVALGNTSTAAAAGAIALGDTANAQATRGVALGSDATATNADDVALGAGSVTSAANPTANGTVGGLTYNYAGTSPSSVVSVGSAGNERQVTNVAAGRVSESSTDAINGSQLYSTQTALGNLAESTANHLGGGSTVNPDGTVSAPSYSVNGNNVSNVGDAITELDKGWNLQSNGANAGAIKAGDTVDIGTAAGEENLTVTKNGNTIQYGLNKDLKVDSVTAGDTVINDNGVSITNGPSITKSGINAAGNPITNVGAGVNGTDAVNKDQLDNAAAAAKTEVTEGKNITVTKTTGADGQDIYNVATADDVDFNKVTVGDVTIDGATGKISGIAAGDVNATSTDAINGSQLAGTAKSVSDALGGGSTVNPDGTVSAPSYTVNGNNVTNVGAAISELDKGWNLQSNGANAAAIKAGDTVDIGTVAGEENLTVTKTGNEIKYGLSRDLKVDSVTAGDTVINDNGVTITNGPSITKSGINAAGNPITNVGAGVNGTDAVNKDQLDNAAATAKTEVTEGKNITVTKTTGADGQDIYNVATANDVDFNNVTVGGSNGVRIDGTTGKISGVTAGTIAAGSTEAINGSQLNDSVASTGDILGGGVTNEGGRLNGPFTVNDKGYDTVADAIQGETAAAKTEVEAGKNMTVTNRTGADGQTIYEVATANDVSFDSVKVGDINLDGSTGKISGVADGTIAAGSTEAINGGQLHGVADSVRSSIGGETVLNPNGSVTTSNVGNTGESNIHDAIDSVRKNAVSAKTTVTEGDNMVVMQSSNPDGSTNYEVATAKDVKFDSVTATDEDGNETILTGKGVSLKDQAGNTTVLGQDGLGFVDPMGNSVGPRITAGGINAGNTVITGVAPGRIAADSQDAINGSQLKGVSDSVAGAIGGNTTVNPDGTIITSDIGGTGKDNINDAIGAVGKAAQEAKSTVSEGKNIVVKESKNVDGSTDYEVSTAPDLEVDSVTAGGTKVDGDGLHITGGPSVTKAGINAGDSKVTGVADGTVAAGSQDAINGGQLHGVADSVKNVVGGNATVNPDGSISTSNIGGTGKDNINDAIGSIGQAAQAAKTSVSNKDGNITVNKTTNAEGRDDYEVGLAKDITVDSVTAKDVNANQVNVGGAGGTTIAADGVRIAEGPSMTKDGINAGGKKVTGVADGVIASGSQEGINGGQLHRSYEDVGKALGGGAGYDPNTGWKGPSYEVAGGKYDNVGDALGAVDNRVTNLGDQLQQAFYDTNKRMDKLEDKMSAGIAATAALENAPFIPGKLTMAAGAAYYNDQSAIGVTFRKTADNGRWSLTTGAAMGSQGNSPLVRVGVSTIID